MWSIDKGELWEVTLLNSFKLLTALLSQNSIQTHSGRHHCPFLVSLDPSGFKHGHHARHEVA